MDVTPTTGPETEAQRLDPLAVCTLPAGDLGDRLAWIERQILPHATALQRQARGWAVELRDAPGLAEKLDQLIALERDCCAEITFERDVSERPGHLRFEIRGIAPDALAFASLREAGTSGSTVTRAARALGVGAVASLLVCCILPLALGSIIGAAAVAPLTSLDAPGPIALGALLGAGTAWWWQGRRVAS